MQTSPQAQRNTPPGRAVAAPRTNRMTLEAVKRGKLDVPIRVLLYATEGLGKSTWGSCAPAPIFLCAESGTANLDVARFPEPRAWTDVLDAIETLASAEHKFETLVVDTLDWIEPMLWEHICARDGKSGVEDYGYGKGYVAALDEWRKFLSALERLRAKKRMIVVLIAHAVIKTFKNPEGEDFDRWQLKLNEKAGGVVKEWCDAVLFGRFETFALLGKGQMRAKGTSSGARMVHTQRTAAWDAKNRHGLPASLPLNWDDFAAAIAAHRPADPAKLREEITEMRAQLAPGAFDPAKLDEALAKAGDNAETLARIKDRIAGKIGEAAASGAAPEATTTGSTEKSEG